MIEKHKNRLVGPKSFISIVKEFLKALGKSYTYNIRKNHYLLFGILWGIPVPVVTIGIGLYYRSLPLSLGNIIVEVAANYWQIFFLIHPLLFGIVFGAMGTVREDKERQKSRFQQSLIEINEELKAKNKKLEELDQLKDNFLSMVSHELLSPLTTVEGYVSFLKDEGAGALTSKQKEMLGISEGQIEYLNRLIEDLIDISKIEAGKFQVTLRCLDIKDVIVKVLDSFRRLANEKAIILDNGLPERVPNVAADEKRIIQVLNNILGNAIKFTPAGGRVSICARERDERMEFSVMDSGIGIPQDKIDKIFDKFYQADSTATRKYGGCGLGLAIARNIIELHKGRIWVESRVGSGSKFFFELNKYREGADTEKSTSDSFVSGGSMSLEK